MNKTVIVAFIFRNEMSCFSFSSFESCIFAMTGNSVACVADELNHVIVLYTG